jgi:hypothetical protein
LCQRVVRQMRWVKRATKHTQTQTRRPSYSHTRTMTRMLSKTPSYMHIRALTRTLTHTNKPVLRR